MRSTNLLPTTLLRIKFFLGLPYGHLKNSFYVRKDTTTFHHVFDEISIETMVPDITEI